MHSKLLPAVLSLLLMAFVGCSSVASKLNNVRIGMTKNDVVAILGQPDSTSAQANIEYLTYYLSNDSDMREQPYMVRLVDAKVESFGRFIQLLDIYNRPVNGAPSLGMGAIMPLAVNTDAVVLLQQLRALHDRGVLTDDEFLHAQSRVLGRPN